VQVELRTCGTRRNIDGILINITTSVNYVVQTRGPSQTSISHCRQLQAGIEKEEMHNDDEGKFEGIECL
jgi:hypothetical protein